MTAATKLAGAVTAAFDVLLYGLPPFKSDAIFRPRIAFSQLG